MPLLCCSRIISVSRSRLVYGFVSTLYLARTSTGVLPRSKKSKGAVNKCVVNGQRLFSLGLCSLPGLFIYFLTIIAKCREQRKQGNSCSIFCFDGSLV